MSLLRKGIIQRVFVLVMLSWVANTAVFAQEKITRTPSVSTNLIDWMLIVPNVGVEIPLSKPQYVNGSSLYLEGKASLNANRVYAPDMNYKVFSGKAEFRRHFRFGEQTHYTINGEYKTENDSIIYLNILDSLSCMIRATNAVAGFVTGKEYWNNRRRNHVDDLGRSYVGVFAQYADYSVCLPIFNYSRGRMGEAAIVGLSLGYQKPFYNFSNRFYLEWEMGGSLGCVLTEFDKYNRVESEVTGQGKWYYPMITDLHVSLVLRRHSVQDLYAKKKQVSDFSPAQITRIIEDIEKKAEKERVKAEKSQAKEEHKQQQELEKEAEKLEKENQKEQEKLEKESKKLEKASKEQQKLDKEAKKQLKATEKEQAKLAKEQEKEKLAQLTKEEKKQLKAAEKEQAKLAKEQAKIEKAAQKEQAKLEKEALKAQQKLEKEAQKLEQKALKEQQKLAKKQQETEA